MLQLAIAGSGVQPREITAPTRRARRVEALRALDRALRQFRGSFGLAIVRGVDADTVEVILPWPSCDAFAARRCENWHLIGHARTPGIDGAVCSVTVRWSAHRRPAGEWERWERLRFTRVARFARAV